VGADVVVAQVLQQFGRIDALVNNAAANLRRRAVDITRDDWDDLIETNITGTFFLTQKVGRHMIASQTSGRIVSIASTHAFVGAPERSA
jgi:NAD(P)-dependent dehydrogenase (short-subunit alcohol dehydrogenase family)